MDIYQKRWREKNKDKISFYQKEWRKRNREKFNGYQKKWREKNKEKFYGYLKNYRSKNKEKFNSFMRSQYYKRRKEYLQNKECAHCKIKDWRVLTFDHITSVSRNGETVTGNLQILCWNCHKIKSIENQDQKITHRKIKNRSFNANLGIEKLKEFLSV